MYIQLIYTTPETAQKINGQPGTSWALVSKGHELAISGITYSNRADALRALECALGGQVDYRWIEPNRTRRHPIALIRPDFTVVRIRRVKI